MTPLPPEPAAPPSHASRWLLHLLLIGMVCLVTAIVFFPSLHADFVAWDDDINLLQNPHIRGLTSQNIAWAFTNYEWVRRYQPLDWISWQANYQIQGLLPFGYHLGNLIEHLACVVLLYFLILKLLSIWQESQRSCGKSSLLTNSRLLPLASAAGALWWAIHPLRVEPVVWATGRIYTQCTMFLLATFLTYLYSVHSPLSAARRRILYIASILLFACSLLSYAIVVGAAVGILLLDIYPLRRVGFVSDNGWWSRAARRVYAEKIPFFIISLAVGLMTLWARIHAHGIWAAPLTLAQFSLDSRIMQAFYTWAYFLWVSWAPFHLSPVYLRLISFNPNAPIFWFSVLVIAGLSLFAVAKAKRFPWFFVAWGYYLVMLVPLLGLTEHPHYTSDRYAQMESLALAVIIAGLLVYVVRQQTLPLLRKLIPAACGIMLICWGLLSYAQTLVWTNSETLFQYMLSEIGSDPYAVDLHDRLAVYYASRGRLNDASEQLNAALQIAPHYPRTLHVEGMLLNQAAEESRLAGKSPAVFQPLYKRAAQAFGQEVQVNGSVDAMIDAGKAYAFAGQFDIAQAALQLAVHQAPQNAAGHLVLGQVYYMAGKLEEARKELDIAIRLSPSIVSSREAELARWTRDASAPSAATVP